MHFTSGKFSNYLQINTRGMHKALRYFNDDFQSLELLPRDLYLNKHRILFPQEYQIYVRHKFVIYLLAKKVL